MRISVGIRKATAIAQTCVAKWIVFCETGFRGNKSKHKVYKNVVATGSAGPGRPAARTDSEGFFFLERATFTPPWMRPLQLVSLLELYDLDEEGPQAAQETVLKQTIEQVHHCAEMVQLEF